MLDVLDFSFQRFKLFFIIIIFFRTVTKYTVQMYTFFILKYFISIDGNFKNIYMYRYMYVYVYIIFF